MWSGIWNTWEQEASEQSKEGCIHAEGKQILLPLTSEQRIG